MRMIPVRACNPDVPAAAPDRRSLSLRTLLLLLVVAVALPLATLAALAVWHAHEQTRSRAEAEVLGQLRSMAALVDREFDRVELGLRALADSDALARGDLAGVEAEMRAMSAQLEGAPIGLATSERQLLSTLWPPGERRPAATVPAVMRPVFATGQPKVSDLITSHNTGRLVIAVVMPATPRQAATAPPDAYPGTARFAFAAALPEGRLASSLLGRSPPDRAGEAAPSSGQRTAAVIDRAGMIVARSHGEAGRIGQPIRPGFAALLTRQAEGIHHSAGTLEGTPASFAFATAPRSGFVVTLSLPEAEFSAPLQRGLRQVGLVAAVILLSGATLAAFLASRIAAALRRLGTDAPAGRPILREVESLAHALAERDLAMAHLTESEGRFRALAQAGALVVWRADAAGGIQDAEGWEALTGQDREALRGTGWQDMLHPEDRAASRRAWERALLAGTTVDSECRVRTRTGDWRWVRSRGVALRRAAAGPVTEWVGMVEDIDDRRQAALALTDREERLRLAIAAARLTTWDYDPVADRGARIGAFSETVAAPETPGFTLGAWVEPIHPECRPRVLALLRAVIEGRSTEFAAEFRVRRRAPQQGWAWIASHGAVTGRDPATGAARRLAGVSQDITERREAEQRRSLLAREVDHRAKNVLAVVQSVLRLTRRDEPERFAATVEARVGALARAHTLLAEQGWASADLRRLAEREVATCPTGSVTLEGPALALDAGAVQPLAMVLHELATNAVKHGAASCLEGEVRLEWRLEAGMLRLTWEEHGGPAPAQPPTTRRGFGFRMMEAIVRGQLGGTLTLDWGGKGLGCDIRLPAERVLADPMPLPDWEADRAISAAAC